MVANHDRKVVGGRLCIGDQRKRPPRRASSKAVDADQLVAVHTAIAGAVVIATSIARTAIIVTIGGTSARTATVMAYGAARGGARNTMAHQVAPEPTDEGAL